MNQRVSALPASHPPFYEVLGCQAPAVSSLFKRAPAGVASHLAEAAEAAREFIPSVDRANHPCLTLAGPWKFRHCLTTFYPWWLAATHQLQHALDRGARRSICETVPAGTRRTSERRAPVCARAGAARANRSASAAPPAARRRARQSATAQSPVCAPPPRSQSADSARRRG